MNPQEINKRIAIACGLDVVDHPDPKDRPEAWKTAYFTERSAAARRKSWLSSAVVKVVPNYHGDLNAMHEAESMLSDVISIKSYCHHLTSQAEPEHATEHLVRCSAADKAEAFLRTIGQWEEGK